MQIFYLKYSGTPKYGNTFGNSLPIGPAQQTTENYLKYRVAHNKGIHYVELFA